MCGKDAWTGMPQTLLRYLRKTPGGGGSVQTSPLPGAGLIGHHLRTIQLMSYNVNRGHRGCQNSPMNISPTFVYVKRVGSIRLSMQVKKIALGWKQTHCTHSKIIVNESPRSNNMAGAGISDIADKETGRHDCNYLFTDRHEQIPKKYTCTCR